MEATPGFEPGVKALQASALPLGHFAGYEKGRSSNRPESCNGADNGARTRDPNLGKVVLYQLSHVRLRESNIRDFAHARKGNHALHMLFKAARIEVVCSGHVACEITSGGFSRDYGPDPVPDKR